MVLDPTLGCSGNRGSHGFSVLYSDEGPAEVAAERRLLAQALAARMVEAGFPAYVWNGYADLYDGDPTHPGVFVDRHVPKQRIKMLRAPHVPSVIIETHQALDAEEVLRWDEPRTHDVFAAAVRAALVDFSALRAALRRP
jgi:N-acetylmuramoyl-L-alanine amidase